MKTGNDPIADLLTRIRNGGMAKKRFVEVSSSKIKKKIVDLFLNEGFIQHYLLKETPLPGVIRIYLKYTQKRGSIIRGLKRISTPGRSLYVSSNRIPKIFGGMGEVIVSTSRGVLTGKRAKEQGVGGKLLCSVW